MSAVRQSKLSNVNQNTIIAGAKALNLKTTANTIEIQGYRFTVTDKGAVRGDYDFITEVAKNPLPKEVEMKPRVLLGILAQAGTTQVVSETLLNQGWTIEKDINNGSLVAVKGTMRMDLTIDKKGMIRTEGTNFTGNSCLSTMDTLLQEVGNFNVLSTEMKQEPQVVLRKAI